MRIAMWSGPRNLSTALMYAFGNRADFAVVDEPFYAAYLTQSGLDHPLRSEVLADQPNDPADVIAAMLAPVLFLWAFFSIVGSTRLTCCKGLRW